MNTIDLLRLELEAVTSLSVTAPERADDGTETDLPLARDPDGNPHLPATTIAGSLRAHLARHGRAELCGPAPDADGEVPDLTPSLLTVLGTRLTPAPDPVTRRTRTAVSRQRGAAREKMLYQQEAWSPGARIVAWLLSEEPLDDSTLDIIARWHPTLGRNGTSGHGRTQLVSISHARLDLTTPEGRREWLSGLGPDRIDELCRDGIDPVPPDDPVDELHWKATIVDGLHIGTGDKEPEKATPVLRQHDGTPYVPGTALKGIFRSRALKIIESLDPERRASGGHHDDTDGDDPVSHHPDCPVCVLFGTTDHKGLLTFHDSPIRDARIDEIPHVALDRFTGGAHDGKLWTDEIVAEGTFTVRITSHRPLGEPHRRLLEHIAHDLHDGYLGIGGRTARGHGSVRLDPEPDPEPLDLDL